MKWLRAFIARHIIDTDPRPEYSQLDALDLTDTEGATS